MNEIVLFGKALKKADYDVKTINEIASKKGWIIHPDCCNSRVLEWLKSLPTNLNTTFYKTFHDVVSKTRLEIAIDQLIHYASTYGTGHRGAAIVPNDNPLFIDYTECNVMLPITREEIAGKIVSMYMSGIALSKDSIERSLALVNEFDIVIDVNLIKNKEVLMHYCLKTGKLPHAPEEMVRYLIFRATEKTLLIKDKNTLKALKNADSVDYLIEQYGIDRLSSVFYRFKPLFLAMKNHSGKVINQLRRRAVFNHKPFAPGFWDIVLSYRPDEPQLTIELEKLSNFRKIKLLQALQIRMANVNYMSALIRNGKSFIKPHKREMKDWYMDLFLKLYNSLVESLSQKKCSVKLPGYINLTLPATEKSFIGNIPLGSYADLDREGILGIHWREKDGASDIDLSVVTSSGEKIGWNHAWKRDNNDLIYSGDLTSANPEAVEMLYFRNSIPDSICYANLYYGKTDSEYTVFFANKAPGFDVSLQAMVDPNDVIFSARLKCSAEQNQIGLIYDKKFYFTNIQTGYNRVSGINQVGQWRIDYMRKTMGSYLDLRQVLTDAGFTFVHEKADMDFSILDRSMMIDLLK